MKSSIAVKSLSMWSCDHPQILSHNLLQCDSCKLFNLYKPQYITYKEKDSRLFVFQRRLTIMKWDNKSEQEM
jgi:hypothetical protein